MSFYWAELVAGGGTVPDADAQQVSPHRVAMRGTLSEPPRCVGLEGAIGASVGCAIYQARPSPCREFEASYENGERNVRCDEARLRYGLPPLSPGDWGAEGVPRRPGRRRIAG